MGCCFSKDGQACQVFLRLFSCSKIASNDERPLPNGQQRRASGASFRSLPGRRIPELGVHGEQRRHSGHQRSQQSPAAIDTASIPQASQRSSSHQTAEARSSQNFETSPNATTPSVQYRENVLKELEDLKSSVVVFIDLCIPHSTKSLRSRARMTIYTLVLENAKRHQNSQSHEEIADAIEDQLKKLDRESFSSPNRRRTDLILISEQKTRIREKLNRDAGCWKFIWRRGDKTLEFPDAERDEVPLFEGHPFEADCEGIMGDE